jgi:thiol:disulfide interchange protein DsbD
MRQILDSTFPRLLLALVLSAVCAGSALAQGEAAKKWRESRIKVPEVSYETTIEPADAKPGDTVEYKVTVKVAAPWHIYAWAEKQPDEGPRSTQFNLFDTGGLTADKGWKPDHNAETTKEPAFPNLDSVAFHQKKVSWSTPLTIPTNAKPGKAVVKGQMLFQICNEGACKPPTTVALPEASVNIQGQ